MNIESHRVVDGGVARSTKDGGTFVCRGCYRECPANPRLKPGVQNYCSRPSCLSTVVRIRRNPVTSSPCFPSLPLPSSRSNR